MAAAAASTPPDVVAAGGRDGEAQTRADPRPARKHRMPHRGRQTEAARQVLRTRASDALKVRSIRVMASMAWFPVNYMLS